MRTHRTHALGPARGLLAVATPALSAFVLPGAAPSAKSYAAPAAGYVGASSGVLLAAAAVLVLVAAVVGYGLPTWRRRRAIVSPVEPFAASPAPVDRQPPRGLGERSAATGPPPHVAARESAGLPQMDFTVPKAGDGSAGRFEPRPPRRGGDDERRLDRGPDITHSGDQRALGYTTFPDRRRAVSPESRYQARRISAACEIRGMALHKLVGDVQSYSGPDLERPGLKHALQLLEDGEAGCLVVVGLDRLSRSAANLGTVIEWLEQVGARLVVLDIDLDTQTEEGRLAARALARVGALERRSGGERQERHASAPVHHVEHPRGRPAVADLPLLQRRIATMRASGMTLQAIADTLNREGVPTLRGGAKWRPSSVQAATGYKRPGRHDDESPLD